MTLGHCLCKAIQYKLTPPVASAADCHCESCRRANSSAFVSWGRVAKEQISVSSGKDFLKRFESSPGAYREFCKQCGSQLFMQYESESEWIYFTFGSLESLPNKIPDKHFSFEEHVSWFSLNDKLPRYRGKSDVPEGATEEYHVKPIGKVSSPRRDATDDFWGGVVSTIQLDSTWLNPDCTLGLQDFSHVEIVYLFHGVAASDAVLTAGHPRENKSWPRVGIFAQRKKNRPNRLGISVCRLLKADGLTLTVEALDAIDGTPVLDIKPYVKEFSPRESTQQPKWISELMRDYFLTGSGA